MVMSRQMCLCGEYSSNTVETHGHLQCKRCKQVITPCCEGASHAVPTSQEASICSSGSTEEEESRENQGQEADGAEREGQQG